jgi:hypothetical protein
MHRKYLTTLLAGVLMLACLPATAFASKRDAIRIGRAVRARHMPHGTIINPTYLSPTSDTIDHYGRGGDSAIWTGHYLAAEAFRYRVTGNKKALANAAAAVEGIRSLVDVTGTDTLARCRLPVAWEDGVNERFIVREEAGHGVYTSTYAGEPNYWIGNTSRDQYVGVFFGLGVAHEVFGPLDDERFGPVIRDVVTRMLAKLLEDDWSVRMPDGAISTTFVGRFDQQLALLQLGRQMNPQRFGAAYDDYRRRYSDLVRVPIALDCTETHESYFKFNLDYITMYTLITREEDGPARRDYVSAYRLLRSATRSHGNAYFNVIDLAIQGPNGEREAETAALMNAWLERPARDEWVDLRGVEQACGPDRSCEPIDVELRVRTDFLWQRSPFLLYGGGAGTIETAGIDYLLPFWMARRYGVAV